MSEVRTEPKRLLDLNPAWLSGEAGNAAIEFDCPCGTQCAFTRVYLPITGRSRHTVTWDASGDDFAALTLSPSIHAVGHWHGWIRDGMAVSC